jgi:MYXO-CTERM domain-containing protein
MRSLFLVLVSGIALANNIAVTKTADSNNPGACTINCAVSPCSTNCSLRETLSKVSDGDSIFLTASPSPSPSPAVYHLTSSNGALTVNTGNLSIQGLGQNLTAIDGGGHGTLLDNESSILLLLDLTLRNGTQGLFNNGTMTISHCAVRDQVAADGSVGRGISMAGSGTLHLINSLVTGNAEHGVALTSGSLDAQQSEISNNGGAGISGSGITTVVSVSQCSLHDNKTEGNLPALYSEGTLNLSLTTITSNSLGGVLAKNNAQIVDCTISNNGGSGITFNAAGTYDVRGVTVNGNLDSGITQTGGNSRIANTTISGNQAVSSGGGVSVAGTGTLRLFNCTVTGNSAPSGSGGGIYRGAATLQLRNSIVAGNSASSSADCNGAISSDGYNLIQDASGCTISGSTTGNIVGQAAALGPLADNGGPTFTQAPSLASPALNAGSTDVGVPCETYDQRGEPSLGGVFPAGRPRANGPRCDIGAFESDRVELVLSVPASSGFVMPGAQTTLMFDVSSTGPNPAQSISFTTTLPANLTADPTASSTGGWSCSGTSTVTCTLASLDPGAHAPLGLVVTAGALGPADVSATVSTAGTEFNGADDTASTTLIVGAPMDLGVDGGGSFDDGGVIGDGGATDLSAPDLSAGANDLAVGAGDLATMKNGSSSSGCKCDLGGASTGAPSLAWLLLVGGIVWRRRRLK